MSAGSGQGKGRGRQEELKRRVEELPRAPGVYLLKDEKARVVYVGKAADLRARVRSYLRPDGDGRAAVPYLIQRIADVDFITTRNEKEALLLENTLIKRHRPRYNVRLRDDKAYLCIRVDVDHAWPRLHMVRRFKKDGALYFGPYTSAKAVRRTIRTLGAIYPLRLCSDKTLVSRDRPCLYHDLKRCSAPCVDLVSRDAYREMVEGLLALLRGKSEPLLRRMRNEMAAASRGQEYERAASLRDQIEALERTTVAQRVDTPDQKDRDVVGLARRGEVVVAAILHVREGRLISKRSFSFKTILPDRSLLARVLVQFYRAGRLVPPEVLLPVMPDDAGEIEQSLTTQRGTRVSLRAPSRGAMRDLVLLAAQNAEAEAKTAEGDDIQRTALLAALQTRLDLDRLPQRIECYDISTTQGAETVGSRVVFQDALPDKDSYRRFKIRSVSGQDDFAAMREILARRFRKDDERPDLVVVDGGPGQLGEAMKSVPDGVTAVGIAKSRPLPGGGRSPERIHTPTRKSPILLPADAPETYLLARVRDEAHRFAITYHRKLRSKRALKSELDKIPGLGPKRRTALLRRFGSAKGVKAATPEELREAGMPAPVVTAIREWAAPDVDAE
ncbi:MAG: excinuclease ABC subunit UvrC [Planctomycetota bacterium]